MHISLAWPVLQYLHLINYDQKFNSSIRSWSFDLSVTVFLISFSLVCLRYVFFFTITLQYFKFQIFTIILTKTSYLKSVKLYFTLIILYTLYYDAIAIHIITYISISCEKRFMYHMIIIKTAIGKNNRMLLVSYLSQNIWNYDIEQLFIFNSWRKFQTSNLYKYR